MSLLKKLQIVESSNFVSKFLLPVPVLLNN